MRRRGLYIGVVYPFVALLPTGCASAFKIMTSSTESYTGKKNSHDLAVRCRCCSAQILQMAGWLMGEACMRDERTPKKRANESKRGKSFAFDR